MHADTPSDDYYRGLIDASWHLWLMGEGMQNTRPYGGDTYLRGAYLLEASQIVMGLVPLEDQKRLEAFRRGIELKRQAYATAPPRAPEPEEYWGHPEHVHRPLGAI